MPRGLEAFKQQRLPSFRIHFGPRVLSALFFLVGTALFLIGLFLSSVNSQVTEIRARYDGCSSVSETEEYCVVEVKIESDLEGPVYLYYELSNYFQNHKRYMVSKSSKQLHGLNVTYDELENTVPRRSIDDVDDPRAIYKPAGLIAWSMFNDTFLAYSDPDLSQPVEFSETNITDPLDRDFVFRNPTPPNDPNDPSVVQADYTDEHFITWMKVAALPGFKKLYGRFDSPLPAGSLYFKIVNNFKSDYFGGEKHLVLSSISFLGGKNDFIHALYVVTGLCLIAAAVLIAYLSVSR